MDEEIKNRLTESFNKFTEIKAVYLFGSHAANRQNPMSDLDLAIVSQAKDPARLKLELLTELSKNRVENADVIIFEEADLLLRYEALKHNVLIFMRAGFDRGFLYSKTIREYLDFLPYTKIHRSAYKKRMQDGTL